MLQDQIKRAPLEEIIPGLREVERKCRAGGVEDALDASRALESGDYETALLMTQRLYAAVLKASDAAQIVARFSPSESK